MFKRRNIVFSFGFMLTLFVFSLLIYELNVCKAYLILFVSLEFPQNVSLLGIIVQDFALIHTNLMLPSTSIDSVELNVNHLNSNIDNI